MEVKMRKVVEKVFKITTMSILLSTTAPIITQATMLEPHAVDDLMEIKEDDDLFNFDLRDERKEKALEKSMEEQERERKYLEKISKDTENFQGRLGMTVIEDIDTTKINSVAGEYAYAVMKEEWKSYLKDISEPDLKLNRVRESMKYVRIYLDRVEVKKEKDELTKAFKTIKTAISMDYSMTRDKLFEDIENNTANVRLAIDGRIKYNEIYYLEGVMMNDKNSLPAYTNRRSLYQEQFIADLTREINWYKEFNPKTEETKIKLKALTGNEWRERGAGVNLTYLTDEDLKSIKLHKIFMGSVGVTIFLLIIPYGKISNRRKSRKQKKQLRKQKKQLIKQQKQNQNKQQNNQYQVENNQYQVENNQYRVENNQYQI